MNETEHMDQLKEAEKELDNAKRMLAEAKKKWTDAETKVIECKIARDNKKEALRVYRATTPKYEASKRDEDIEKFRKDHPELVAFAKQRDLHKECFCGHGMHEGICGQITDVGDYTLTCRCPKGVEG